MILSEIFKNICYIAGDFELSIIGNCTDQEDAMNFVAGLFKLPEIDRIVPHIVFKQFK